MKKLLLALAAALAVSVPAFAYSSDSFVHSIECPNGKYWRETSGHTTYFFGIDAGNGNVNVYGISHGYGYYQVSTNSGTSWNDYYCSSRDAVNSGSDLYYGTAHDNPVAQFSGILTPYPEGTLPTDACADFLLWENNPNPSPAVASSFTVPCGNVLYFQVSSEQDVTLSAQMPQLSYLVQFGNNAYGPWGDTGIEYGPAASLPSSGTTFPILSMDPVQWAKGEPKNILGQSKIGIAAKHCLVGQWYALFCPLTSPQVLDASTGDHAMGASVVVSGSFSHIKVYPLSETLDYDNPLGASYESGSNDGYDSYFDGSSDENGTVTWTNQDGQVQAPQSGGTNYVSPAANAESLLSQIRQLLANIVSELKSLFTFGYEAVQDLVGIMRDFVNVLGGLYTWLPAEVYSALMSAVVVAIVIGVFKVFL